MKQKLNLRNAILWTIALILPVIFFASFGANTYLYLNQGGYTLNVTWTHGFWGATYGYATGEGSVYVDPSERVGSICGIIAVFMFLAAAAGLILVTLLMKNEKLQKILIFVCGGVILVASVLLFFTGGVAWKQYAKIAHVSVEELKSYVRGRASCPFGVASGVVGILLAGGVVVAQLIPNKQFIKSSSEASKEEPAEVEDDE